MLCIIIYYYKSTYGNYLYILYLLNLYLLYKLDGCINSFVGKELFFNMQYFLNVLHITNSDSFFMNAIPGVENDEQKNLA